jgi:hypothetical protein
MDLYESTISYMQLFQMKVYVVKLAILSFSYK